MEYEQIAAEAKDGILTIRLDRPDRMNAYTFRMREEICHALDRADADDDVRVVVFTGSGRAYCAGADLEMGARTFDPTAHSEVTGEPEDSPDDFRDDGGRLVMRLFRSTKPLIAAVNGPAVGVGATMTLPMDIRICAEEARFGFVFARRGITPDGCSTWFLPKVVGIDRALEWCFTGRVFDAAEALESRLVREVVPGAQLLDRAYEIARSIAERTPAVAVAVTRALLWGMQTEPDPWAAHRIESRALHWAGQSEDAREGVLAFLEKRPPHFGLRVSSDLPDELRSWPTE
ncbi:enoyl-CoA hydratase-related protein [Yinghuangia soli]|uniref:Enoyl-CoA hydratase-related protein n=1 Tax=Yinghuangia soli TaxID=2908204 RepID=A0AA41Q946_9ACTN|nr:enoyl-CoA hydratase-related protein [Yinghuangia soli]MCF2532614.1 enoyl-CoA hydratase-related protein [Yinghuangia soli]